jgi:hypothetical protein
MGLLDGLGSGLESILSNPAFQALVPAAMGAAGGALSSPRLAGTRGAIGRGLLGGAQGFSSGIKSAQEQQSLEMQAAKNAQEAQYQTLLSKHLGLEDQIIQGNLDARQRRLDLFTALPPEEQKRYGTPDNYEEFLRQTLAAAAPTASLKGAVSQLFKSEKGKDYLAQMGYTDPSQLPTDRPTLGEIFKGFKVANPKEEAETAAAYARRDESVAKTAQIKQQTAENKEEAEPKLDKLKAQTTAAEAHAQAERLRADAAKEKNPAEIRRMNALADQAEAKAAGYDARASMTGKGEVTPAMLAQARLKEFNRRHTELQKILAKNAEIRERLSYAPPEEIDKALMPVPDVPDKISDWIKSDSGKDFDQALDPSGKASGRPPVDVTKPSAETAPKAAPKAEATPAGAVAKAGKTVPIGKKFNKDGKNYEVRPDGYIYEVNG